MKKWQRISLSALIAFLLATVLSVGAFSQLPAAHAGSNGQQIYFTTEPTANGNQGCPSGTLQSVSIVGTNQNGIYTPWSQTSTDGVEVTTTNYWWVGNVTISYQINGVQNSVDVSIPQQAADGQKDFDTAYVNCIGNRISVLYRYSYDGYYWTCITPPDPLTGGNPTGHYTAEQTITGYKYSRSDGSSPTMLFTDPNREKSYIFQITDVLQNFMSSFLCD